MSCCRSYGGFMVEEFGRFWGLKTRAEELEAEQRWAEIREEIADDYRQENQRWHQDPVSTRRKSEVRQIVEGYPPHLTVGNGLAQNPDGSWVDPDSPAVVELVREFEKADWPLGTDVKDTVTYISRIRYPE